MKKLNKANVPAFLLDAVAILADYGIRDDYKDALEYNDPSNIETALMLCFSDKNKVDDFLRKTDWDEEFNLAYDDEVFTLPIAICDLIKKYELVEDSETKSGKAIGMQRTENTTYWLRYKCPHCNRSHRKQDENKDSIVCDNCYGEIILND